ncbi:MAG: PDZ domain-containing protein [Nanoarchaeota archaeon]|nr:PDZ domain-containing protein [Nanoarchaeota archaeon]MBU1028037.1 PDZ domain-containing protein [Nanoarchaeota archaeon]
MALKFTWRIWILIFVLVLSLLSIFGIPSFQKGVIIKSVDTNSTAFEQGLRAGQIITSIDGKKITNIGDFSSSLENKYNFNESVKIIIHTKDSEIILFSKIPPEIIVSEIQKTNIKMGLDLAGGSRALVQAQDKKLTSSEVNDLVDVISNRLNVYGIADLNIRPVSDLSGNNFMLIEIAGATPKDLEELISKQGKFEAKIGNETVFIGGEKDITSVCRNDATCAGIVSCQVSGNSEFCNFRFTIYLSEEAANKHAEITGNLDVNATNPEYLSEKLDLYLDDKLVDSLFISKGLKGRVTTQIAISGSGSGQTRAEAYDAAEESMHKLQTVLITGSLPYKLEIAKLDTISPILGDQFIKNIFLAGFLALLAVVLIIFFRYKKIKSSLALLLTSVSEIVIILGIASLIEWNLDLPSIAGILATIGTGIDQQIIILDEAKQTAFLSIKQKLKRAFAIILGAYFTAVVALLPLLWAGAGLLKGFAVTTIIGITTGILITRPAFTDMVKKIEED